MTRRPNAEEWRVLRRLQSAGCPIDHQHLPMSLCPLRDIRKTRITGTNIFPTKDGFGIAFGIRALACAALTVCRFDLRADWFKGPISWQRPCEQHAGYHCFPGTKGHLVQFRSGDVLADKTSLLKRGWHLDGILAGTVHEILFSTLPEELEVKVYIEDLAGNEYWFPVLLENKLNRTIASSPPKTEK